jgi:hypothetical protein
LRARIERIVQGRRVKIDAGAMIHIMSEGRAA